MVELIKKQVEGFALFVLGLGDGERAYTFRGKSVVGGGEVLPCYLTPFDALIDFSGAPLATRANRKIQVLEVAEVAPDALTGLGKGPVGYGVHTAWRAHAGLVLVGLDAVPHPFMFGLPPPQGWQDMTVLPASLARLAEVVHERAGLFAWRESARFDTCTPERLLTTMSEVWERVPVTVVDEPDPDFDQLAPFDPEAAQWHFVPALGVLEEALS